MLHPRASAATGDEEEDQQPRVAPPGHGIEARRWRGDADVRWREKESNVSGERERKGVTQGRMG